MTGTVMLEYDDQIIKMYSFNCMYQCRLRIDEMKREYALHRKKRSEVFFRIRFEDSVRENLLMGEKRDMIELASSGKTVSEIHKRYRWYSASTLRALFIREGITCKPGKKGHRKARTAQTSDFNWVG